ncbi:MAG: TatD family hydrolase [Thermoleophilaceae bacterium]
MIDSHCHLDSCKAPAADVVARARAAGVTRLATVGTDPDSIRRAVAAAHEFDEVFAIAGCHPNEADGFDPKMLAAIERAASDGVVRAIGETGLDFYREGASRADQLRAFEAQVDLAARVALPLVIHTRAATGDTFDVLRERARELTVVLHCFTVAERLDECVEAGYVCSFAGNVTYPKAAEIAAAASLVPDELLLVETDSPYLSPQPVRGKPNEPANVVLTAEHVARLREVSYQDLETVVERNAARIFGW